MFSQVKCIVTLNRTIVLRCKAARAVTLHALSPDSACRVTARAGLVCLRLDDSDAVIYVLNYVYVCRNDWKLTMFSQVNCIVTLNWIILLQSKPARPVTLHALSPAVSRQHMFVDNSCGPTSRRGIGE